jgi:hypothetical protein
MRNISFKIPVLLILILLSIVSISGKSVKQAMLMSALLPGTGEIYAGNLTRGVSFITADVVILYSANRYSKEVDWLTDSYQQYANTKAGCPSGMSADYYKLLHNWQSSDEYNSAVEMYFRNLGLARYNDPFYYNSEIETYHLDSAEGWQWNSIADWKKYKSIRKDKQTQILQKKMAIGAAIANRVISVIDSAVLTKRYNKRFKPSLSVTPDFINDGAMLSLNLEF